MRSPWQSWLLPLGFVSLAGLLPAQVILVDVNNGPGTQYTSLAAAVAAVPDGATLLVRPGTYHGPTIIDGKGLTVLGDPGVRLGTGGLVVQNTLPHQANVVRNLIFEDSWDPSVYGRPPVHVSNCAGLVVFERLTAVVSPWHEHHRALSIANSAQVLLRSGTVTWMSVTASQLVIEGSVVQGRRWLWPVLPATPAIEISGASVQVAHSMLAGGAGNCGQFPCQPNQSPSFPNAPAVTMSGGSLVLRAPSIVTAGEPSQFGAPVTGSGTVRADPRVAMNNPVSPPPQLVPMPSLFSTSRAPGGAITATASGPTGHLLLLALGLPGPTWNVPGFVDPFWLDPAFHFLAAIGVAQSTPLTASVAVPNNPTLLGFRVAWQAVSNDGVHPMQASNPSIAFVHP